MNNVQLIGRLVADPDVRYSNGGSSIARFRMACDRKFKQENGPDADFISCIAFGKTADFIEKYFHKGQRIGLTGRIQTGSYKNEQGTSIYTTDVVAENVEFVESKGNGNGQSAAPASQPNADGFMNIPSGIDEELPFN